MLKRLAVVGLGLIGSSVCRAAKERGLAGEVAGCDVDVGILERARGLGFLDECTTSAREAARGADMVLAAVPLGSYGEVADVLRGGVEGVLTDVGSVKGVVGEVFSGVAREGWLVPGHPVSGTERSGPEAGFGDLFENRWCVLTPGAEAKGEAIGKVRRFWEGCGALVEEMDARRHDRVLALTSHVPHVLAYAMVLAAEGAERVSGEEVVKFSAGGFRDFTRLASSDAVMWRDVFLANGEETALALGVFEEALGRLRGMVERGDATGLREAFEGAKEVRGKIVEAGQETAREDFGRRD